MGQEGEPKEVIDLSGALNEARLEETIKEENSSSEYEDSGQQKIPAIYRLIMKISGGAIKTEAQAKTVAIIIIIITNLITFSLLFKDNFDSTPQDTFLIDETEAIPA